MEYLGPIAAAVVLQTLAHLWRGYTKSGKDFEIWCQTWKTDAVTGVGLAFVIVVGSMVAAIYIMRWRLGYL